jgi:hypothetical protein
MRSDDLRRLWDRFLKIFSPKNSAKILASFTQNKAKLRKILIITLVFEKKRHFLEKSLKIVIITSTPGWPVVNNMVCPQGCSLSLGVNLAPRGENVP